MYLSHLILNPRSRQARRDAAEPYEMHRTLMRAFPDPGADRMLWRLDVDRRRGWRVVYVQSGREPDWPQVTAAHADYFLDAVEADVDENPACKEMPESKLQLPPGKALSFRLRANPAKKVGSRSKSEREAGAPRNNGRRVGLASGEEQLTWLRRKGEHGGFAVLSVRVVREDAPERIEKGRKEIGGRQQSLSLLSVRFDGVLQVTDTERFLKTLHAGIGPGKGLGFGLLSLAPA